MDGLSDIYNAFVPRSRWLPTTLLGTSICLRREATCGSPAA